VFRILLVEDSPGDVFLLREALQQAGLNYELTVIHDGEEALAFARSFSEPLAPDIPDLAVIDLNLPKVSGTEIIEAMRENGPLKDLPVAILTSSSAPWDRARAHSLGIQKYIAKPSDLEEYLKVGFILKELLLGKGLPAELGH
jgi:CheY-like chemotaxis protein